MESGVLCHALVRLQVYSWRWNSIRPPTAMHPPPPQFAHFDLLASLEGRTHNSVPMAMSRGQRFTESGEHSMFPEMSPSFMAYCVAIKHLLGSQLIKAASSFSSPSPLTPSEVTFPEGVFFFFINFCLPLSQEDESENRRLMQLSIFYWGLCPLSSIFNIQSPIFLSLVSFLYWVCLTGVNIALLVWAQG